MQDRPKYSYSTIEPSKGIVVPRQFSKKADSMAEAAHWGIGVVNWAANKYKINKAMEELAGEIDELMSTDGGVMVAHHYKIPPLISGNSDKPIFTSANIVGAGRTYDEVLKSWRRTRNGPMFRPYYGEGWKTSETLIWITMKKP